MGIGQRSLDVLHKRKQEKLSAADIELIVTDSGHGVFSCSKYLVVPRIRWAIDRIDHECDLLAMSKTGYLHEIEIKVSRSDLLADKRKNHTHASPIIKRLWFAVPVEMAAFARDNIPAAAGLVVCDSSRSWVVRRPTFAGRSKPLPSVREKMHAMLAIRYWNERARDRKRLIKARARSK